MIAEINKRYKTFGDAKINRIDYSMVDSSTNNKNLIVLMTCLNWETEQWEQIRLEFKEILSFRFIDTAKVQSSIVFEAMLEEREGNIVFDFYPIQVDGLGELAEDPNSTFSIHCKQVNYTVT